MSFRNRIVMDMLYKYKDTFSLRDEISTCPSIVEIDVTDKSPYLLDHITLKEDDIILDKEMKKLFYLNILKEGFSAYSIQSC